MEPLTTEEQRERMRKSKSAILWLGIVSIIMMFSGLTSAYIVRQGEGDWLQFEVPSNFYTSTAVILISSITMNYAFQAAKKGSKKNLLNGLLFTLALGIVFTILQFQGWKQLVNSGVFFVGHPAGSFFYVLTGLHLAHLTGGLLSLIYVIFRTVRNKYSAENTQGVKLCAIYWHFLDILWLYLFLFLIFNR